MPWEVRYSNSRSIPYFFNPDTGKSAWDPPKGLTEAQIRQLPGATQYLKPLGPGIDPNYIPNPGSDTGGISEQLGDVKLAPIQQPKRVRASHILAKSTKSRRPSSWRQPQITRSPEEARQIIQGHIDHLKSLPPDQLHAVFTDIARTESDCSSAKAGGDLGWFHRGQMQASFENTAFDLPVGAISGIVETESGVHVILRTG